MVVGSTMEILSKRYLDKELIPLKLILGLTSSVFAISLALPGNGLVSPALSLIADTFGELVISIYFFILAGITLFGLYYDNIKTSTVVNLANIITWSFVSISMYISMYPDVATTAAAYSVISSIATWVYIRSNIR